MKYLVPLFLLLVTAACTTAPSPLKITSPADGATVASPVQIKVTLTGLTLIPAATPSAAGQGHLHVIIDDNPPPSGQAVARDDTHIHIGTGADNTEVKLSPGKHKIVVIFTDSNHIVGTPPVVATVNVTVSP